jgi:hypothetical protein
MAAYNPTAIGEPLNQTVMKLDTTVICSNDHAWYRCDISSMINFANSSKIRLSKFVFLLMSIRRNCAQQQIFNGPISPERLEQLVKIDLTTGFSDHISLSKIFTKLVLNNYYSQHQLPSVLGLMATYPSLNLIPKSVTDVIYSRLSNPLHRMTS